MSDDAAQVNQPEMKHSERFPSCSHHCQVWFAVHVPQQQAEWAQEETNLRERNHVILRSKIPKLVSACATVNQLQEARS